jgi:hypothetical protein
MTMSVLIGPDGNIVHPCCRAVDERVTFCDIEAGVIKAARVRSPVLADRRLIHAHNQSRNEV